MYIFTPNTLIKSSEVNANFTESLDVANFNNPYKFSAYRNSSYTTVANTWTIYPYNLELFDTDNDYSTSTYKYTAPITGYYFFSARPQMEFAFLRGLCAFYVDNAEKLRGVDFSSGTGSQYVIPTVSGILYLTAGQAVDLRYFVSGATASSANENTAYFQGYFLSK